LALEPLKGKDLSSLNVLGTVGEPINEEAWNWYNTNIGRERCPIVDTWWSDRNGRNDDNEPCWRYPG